MSNINCSVFESYNNNAEFYYQQQCTDQTNIGIITEHGNYGSQVASLVIFVVGGFSILFILVSLYAKVLKTVSPEAYKKFIETEEEKLSRIAKEVVESHKKWESEKQK